VVPAAGEKFMTSWYGSLVLGMIAVTLCAAAVAPSVAATADSNNSFVEAIQVRNNDMAWGSLDVLNDVSDFYKIYLEAGDMMEAYLNVPSGQDFDTYLYSPTFELLDSSVIDNPGTGQYYEDVYIEASSAGWYYIETNAYSGAGPYLLEIYATAIWTVMVYLDGDCNLEADAVDDFMEMSSIGSSSEVNIVVQFDRWNPSSDPADDTRYGDWTDCERFLVTQGMTPELSNSFESLGEVNMADNQTLIDFGNMAIQYFPAHHYALVLWDHGGSWTGVCWDDSMLPSVDSLTMPELGSALSSITTTNSLSALDVVWFDACNMASIEVACEISSYCSNLVGSEKTEPNTGANYGLTLSALIGNPYMTPTDLSTQAVTDYVDSYDASPEPGYAQDDVTQSASNMTGIPSLVDSVNLLAGELCTNIASYVNYVNLSWYEAEYYDYDYVDLHDLAWKLVQYLPPGLARSYALDVMNGVNSTVFAEGHWDVPGGDTIAVARGLTIYFPDYAYYSPMYGSSGIGFPSFTQWDEFLNAYYACSSLSNTAPSFVDWSPIGSVVMDEGQNQTFSVTASDAEGNAISYFWYVDGIFFAEGTPSITYRPNYTDSGLHTFEVELWDGALSYSHTWTVSVTDVDIVTPTSQVSSISPYWRVSFPITVQATAADPGGPIAEVSLVYRYSYDNVTWGGWMAFQADSTLPWQWSFDFPDGNGYYEFFSRALDQRGNREGSPAVADARCAYDGEAPGAVFTAFPMSGDMSTLFGVNASSCADFKDPTGSLQVRWDWDNDGTWDTDWTYEKSASHQYAVPGDYVIRLEVRDSNGMTNSTTMTVHVDAVIPEFGTIMVPLVGCMVILLVMGRARRRQIRRTSKAMQTGEGDTST
jgi:hypothetical protein